MEEIPKTESVSLERALPLDEALLDICENADTLKQPLIIKEVWASIFSCFYLDMIGLNFAYLFYVLDVISVTLLLMLLMSGI